MRAKEKILRKDVVIACRAIKACDELLGIMKPIMVTTRVQGEVEGVEFLATLVAYLDAFKEGMRDVISGE